MFQWLSDLALLNYHRNSQESHSFFERSNCCHPLCQGRIYWFYMVIIIIIKRTKAKFISRIRKSIAAIDTPKSFFEPTNNRPVLSCLAPGDARWNPSKPRSHPAHSTRRKPQKPRFRTKWHKILNRGLLIGGYSPKSHNLILQWYPTIRQPGGLSMQACTIYNICMMYVNMCAI